MQQIKWKEKEKKSRYVGSYKLPKKKKRKEKKK